MRQPFNTKCLSPSLVSYGGEARSHAVFTSTAQDRGVTLTELMATVAMIGIVSSIGAVSLFSLGDPLRSSTFSVEGAFKQTRVTAMASTTACRIQPDSAGTLITECASRCTAATSDWEIVEDLQVDLDDGVTMAETAWDVCFDSRGIADNSGSLNLSYTDENSDLETSQVAVLFGGAIWTSYSDDALELAPLN